MDEGLRPLNDLIGPADQWRTAECPKLCGYAQEGLLHFHEEHLDGSRAVLVDRGLSLELAEFQGTLGF